MRQSVPKVNGMDAIHSQFRYTSVHMSEGWLTCGMGGSPNGVTTFSVVLSEVGSV